MKTELYRFKDDIVLIKQEMLKYNLIFIVHYELTMIIWF